MCHWCMYMSHHLFCYRDLQRDQAASGSGPAAQPGRRVMDYYDTPPAQPHYPTPTPKKKHSNRTAKRGGK